MGDDSVMGWKRKIDALLRLAEDQAGKPEGDLARQKLDAILAKHPEARDYEPVKKFMLKDVGRMKRMGINTGGSWTGGNMAEAIAMMIADYQRRIEEHERGQRALSAAGGLHDSGENGSNTP